MNRNHPHRTCAILVGEVESESIATDRDPNDLSQCRVCQARSGGQVAFLRELKRSHPGCRPGELETSCRRLAGHFSYGGS
jgi:hypothetical protein